MKLTGSKLDPRPGKTVDIRLFWVLLGAMLTFAVVIRFYDLRADPPGFFATGSQDLTTDGAYLTLHARQAVQFGEWDLFGFQNWTPFKVSMVSGVSYLLFSISGVSRATANATGGILSLGGILLFLGALWKWRSKRFLLLLAFFLCSSFILTTYSRVPFSEDGLLFLAGLTFMVYSLWFDNLGGKVAVGILVALCGLLGKSFGFLLGAGPLVAILLVEREDRIKGTLALIGSFAAAFALFWLVFYRGQNFFTFLWEHGTGAHGFPHGFSSPKGFLECLIAYARYGLHSYSPVVSLLFCLSLLTILLKGKQKVTPDRQSVFMWSWFVAWVLTLSPFNYLPLRYLFPLIVPMSVFAADYLDRFGHMTIGGFGRFVWWKVVLILVVNWMFVYYVSMNFVVINQTTEEYFQAVWLLLPVAILLSALVLLTFRQKSRVISKRTSSVAIVVVLLLTLAVEGYRHFEWLSSPTRTIEYANLDTAALVDSKAVIAGQYGPAVSYDARVRSFPLFISEDSAELISKLQKYPITHIAVGEASWEELIRRQPIFNRASVLVRYWVRDNIVTLVRVAELFGNRQAMQVPPTDFERSVMADTRGENDSAGESLKRFMTAHSNSRVGLAASLYYNVSAGSLEAQRGTIEKLTTLFSTDFVVCEIAAVYYESVYRESHHPEDLDRAEKFLARSCNLSPQNAAGIRQYYAKFELRRPFI